MEFLRSHAVTFTSKVVVP